MASVRVAILIAVGALALTQPGQAQIDVTGRWHGSFADTVLLGLTFERDLDLVQSGSMVTASSPYASGSIDAGTGALHLDGTVTCFDLFRGPYPVPISLDAVVAPDGMTFDGTFAEAVQAGRSCLAVSGPVHAVRIPAGCGNSAPDPGEECDAGPTGNACCTSTCTARPAGTACVGEVHACATNACDGAGTCAAAAVAAGTVCRLAADACDTAEVCDGVALDCPPPQRPAEPDGDGDGVVDFCDDCVGEPLESPRMTLGTFGASPRHDFVSLRARVALPAGTQLPNPRTTWKLVEIRDAMGAPVVYAQVPGGEYSTATGYGWVSRRAGWLYRNRAGGFGQVERMTLDPAPDGGNAIDVHIRARRSTLGVTAAVLPLRLKLILDGLGPSVQCGEQRFAAVPAAGPTCASSRNGSVLSCH